VSSGPAGRPSSHSRTDERTYTYPRFQPVSVAFVDAKHGVLAEDDWVCQKPHGCQGRLLITSDGGAHWHLAYTGARGFELFPVRGSDVVYAFSGNAMLISLDAGVHWKRLQWSPAVVSFVSPSHGWRLGPARTLAHPPALLETRDDGRSWSRRFDRRVRLAGCAVVCLGDARLDCLQHAGDGRLPG
jgi:photosystem II stability/assembly factor-like uncharacterized protein